MNMDCARQFAPIVFSDTYFEARLKFLSATPSIRSYRCASEGPSGEALFTDVAYFGRVDAKRILVLISGTHGAEGYCGSAAQLSFLQTKLHECLPTSTGVLLIHALNPYGFAWDRRVTAEGCDLNRNFVDFSGPLPGNSGYEELAEHLVPADISPEGLQRAEAAIAEYRSLHGELKYHTARKSGQYTRPGGMFYGGDGPTGARQILERAAADFDLESRERVVIVDYHTGLGPYGYGELQCEQPSGLDGYDRAVGIFGPSVTSPDLGTSSSIALHGTQDEFWQRLLSHRHTYVCLEFGTYSIERAREVLRNDHWLFTYWPNKTDSELGRGVRRACKEFYYPQRLDWQEMVIWRSHQVHRQAIEALS